MVLYCYHRYIIIIDVITDIRTIIIISSIRRRSMRFANGWKSNGLRIARKKTVDYKIYAHIVLVTRIVTISKFRIIIVSK